MEKKALNTIGKIIKLSGNSGEFLVSGGYPINEFTDFNIPVFFEINNDFVPFFIEQIKPSGNDKCVVKFEGIDSEKKAKRFLNKKIFIEGGLSDSEKELDWENLTGFVVTDKKYGKLGVIKAIDNNPKNPLMIITHLNGEIIFPLNENFISSFDPDKRLIVVNSPEGLIELYIGEEK